jgi:hypothetical protein
MSAGAARPLSNQVTFERYGHLPGRESPAPQQGAGRGDHLRRLRPAVAEAHELQYSFDARPSGSAGVACRWPSVAGRGSRVRCPRSSRSTGPGRCAPAGRFRPPWEVDAKESASSSPSDRAGSVHGMLRFTLFAQTIRPSSPPARWRASSPRASPLDTGAPPPCRRRGSLHHHRSGECGRRDPSHAPSPRRPPCLATGVRDQLNSDTHGHTTFKSDPSFNGFFGGCQPASLGRKSGYHRGVPAPEDLLRDAE